MPPESHPSSTVTSVEGEDRTGKERIQMGATRYLSTKSSPYSFAYTDVQLCNCSQTPYSVHTHLLNYTQFLRDGQQWALQVYNMQLFHSSSLNTTKLLKLRKKKKKEKREKKSNATPVLINYQRNSDECFRAWALEQDGLASDPGS